MVSPRSAHRIRAQALSERGKPQKRSACTGRFLQGCATLQESLPFEQQLTHILETAREEVGLDRLMVWAAAPERDRLIHVAGSGVSEEDRLSLGERMEMPLREAGAMAKVYREKVRLIVDQVLPLSEAAKAHAHLSNRGTLGKVLLIP